jgi:hypothetical protein
MTKIKHKTSYLCRIVIILFSSAKLDVADENPSVAS